MDANSSAKSERQQGESVAIEKRQANCLSMAQEILYLTSQIKMARTRTGTVASLQQRPTSAPEPIPVDLSGRLMLLLSLSGIEDVLAEALENLRAFV